MTFRDMYLRNKGMWTGGAITSIGTLGLVAYRNPRTTSDARWQAAENLGIMGIGMGIGAVIDNPERAKMLANRGYGFIKSTLKWRF